MTEQPTNLDKVTRVEVIDDEGRSYTRHNVQDIQFSLQDDDRTLKIFLRSSEPDIAQGDKPE
ncbi:MAG: hypothetical protein Alpg2KO_25530 [Alphaproteobacteria bacterium]